MNIILIGMPGSGKSSAGVLLAKELCKMFVDTDLIIQQQHKKTLQQLIDAYGPDEFKKFEESAILSLYAHNAVIATGGSVIYSEKAMNHLKNQGIVIFLDCPLSVLKKRIRNFSTRGVVLPKGVSFKSLFEKRYPLYKKYADYTVPCAFKPIIKTVDDILQIIREEVNKNEDI